MARSILAAVQQIKTDVAQFLSAGRHAPSFAWAWEAS
jgi:hypothetical protein